MQILYSIILEYHAIPTSSAYSPNFLRIHDAPGKNNTSKKIKQLGRIQDTRGLYPLLLIVTAGANMIPLTWWAMVAGMVETIGG